MELKATPKSNSPRTEQRRLWEEAIKWPIYSIAAMPILLATGLTIGTGKIIRWDQLVGFLVASILLLVWENLSNDLYDADTGVDALIKPHSIVALVSNRKIINYISFFSLGLGLFIIFQLAQRSSPFVLYLVLGCCLIGYLYQGPPFRLGYKTLGEPLCWIAFGPLATAASLLVISPLNNNIGSNNIPWKSAIALGSGPALATTLVLFCSHFHQVSEDKANGKISPIVLLGTKQAANLVPLFIVLTLVLEWVNIIQNAWPITSLLGVIGLPAGFALIRLVKKYHNKPNIIRKSKFLALRFQVLNGFGLSLGLALGRLYESNPTTPF